MCNNSNEREQAFKYKTKKSMLLYFITNGFFKQLNMMCLVHLHILRETQTFMRTCSSGETEWGGMSTAQDYAVVSTGIGTKLSTWRSPYCVLQTLDTLLPSGRSAGLVRTIPEDNKCVCTILQGGAIPRKNLSSVTLELGDKGESFHVRQCHRQDCTYANTLSQHACKQ